MSDADLNEATQDFAGDSCPLSSGDSRPLSAGDKGCDEDVDSESLPAQISRYVVQRILGRGGFGIVYLAWDEQLNRQVAVKVPHARRITRPQDVELYLAEAQTVASLDHPGIVPVFDVGSTPEFPCYIVSKYVEGTDLASLLRKGQLGHLLSASLVASIADALHYAHKRGLVHRDVKPGNILIGVDQKPHLVDFGLALREENIGTGPKYAGTASYMSPEQARGEGHRVDGRSDVFSVGVVFYQLLTGRLPFRSEDLLDRSADFEPKPLSQYDETLPRELNRICMKALARRSSERYSSAWELADDLRHFLKSHADALSSEFPRRMSEEVADSASRNRSGGEEHRHGTAASLPASTSELHQLKVVPRGLRSFDIHDADFFLELLPGARDRTGLPESIQFWKTKIEEADSEGTFSIGLLYGPSGCGKSSLVKAGLLPRLSSQVISVYIEATSHGTETRLLNALRKRCPGLRDDLGLKDSLAALRRGHCMPAGTKVLIVLDQFEQWLHTTKFDENSELTDALRQCNGSQLQCVVMVRDDFWMAATRFMREVDVPLLERQNSAAVDLFPTLHARRVLRAFGRAYGVLPETSGEIDQDRKSFINQAIAGLAQDGRVICVRLALFAEMMKGKLWTPATLKEMGGTQGVGVTFLEESFSASTAPPPHRYHQIAARAVLKLLLPPAGVDIKGHMRSFGELQEASGYSSRPRDFEDLIRILDAEIRLITPTESDSSDGDANHAASSGDQQRYYQLTHDYLIPSLREWLTRKQKETRRGRAELKLEERATSWNAISENRQLPSLPEWFGIRLHTRPGQWTPSQQRMMRKADAVYGLRFGLAAVLLVAVIGAGLSIRRELARRERTLIAQKEEDLNRAEAARMVDGLLQADTTQLKRSIEDLRNYRKWANSDLIAAFQKAEDGSNAKLHAGLALVNDVTIEPDHDVVEYLRRHLLTVAPAQFSEVRDLLIQQAVEFAKDYWMLAMNSEESAELRFHAGCALAAYDPRGDHWSDPSFQQFMAARLVAVNPVFFNDYRKVLRPVSIHLIPPLAEIFSALDPDSLSASLCTELLADYAKNDPETLANLVTMADPVAFQTLFPVLQAHRQVAIDKLQEIMIQRGLPAWNDQPLNSATSAPGDATRAAIEFADGMIAERFAFCQTLPWDQLMPVMEQLNAAGYRPTRIRPYTRNSRRLAAIVWKRDSGRWLLETDLTTEQLPSPDQSASKEGLLPEDIAAYQTAENAASGTRYLLLWGEPGAPAEQRRLRVNMEHSEILDFAETLKAQKFPAQTVLHTAADTDATLRFSGIWSNMGRSSRIRTASGTLDHTDQPQWDIAFVSPRRLSDPRETYRQQLAVLGSLPVEQQEDLPNRRARAIAHHRLGSTSFVLADLQLLIDKGVIDAEVRRIRTLTLAKLQKEEEAREELERYLELEPRFSMKAFVQIQVPAWLGELGSASDELHRAAKMAREPDDLYVLACAAALCSEACATSEPVRSQEFAERALELLRRSAVAGFVDIQDIRKEPDFACLHSDPRFGSMVEEFESTGLYSGIWDDNVTVESRQMMAMSVKDLLEQSHLLASDGFRPVSIAAVTSEISEAATSQTPVAAVWHRPRLPRKVQQQRDREQATAAIALLRQGLREEILGALRTTDRPESLTQFVHRCRDRGVVPQELIDCVRMVHSQRITSRGQKRKSDDLTLYGLLLALGEYRFDEIPVKEQAFVLDQLVHWYETDPSAAVHGVTGWLLEHWDHGELIRRIHETAVDCNPDREWFRLVIRIENQQPISCTFVVFQSGLHVLGSRDDEPDRTLTENRHSVVLTRPFAILNREITVNEMQLFNSQYRSTLSRGDTGPEAAAFEMTWAGAVQYCRWLTEQAGLTEADQAYQIFSNPVSEHVSASERSPDRGSVNEWKFTPENRGFRLPTEAEWEVACRSGMASSFSFGDDAELLKHYAWFTGNSQSRVHATGELRPGPRGLHDMHGNVFEWCHDWYAESLRLSWDPEGLPTGFMRVTRGGSWGNPPGNIRSASRDAIPPMDRRDSLGFRIVILPQ